MLANACAHAYGKGEMKTLTKTVKPESGPWTVVIDNDSADPIRIFHDDGTGNGDHIRMIAGDPQSMANARLISAAPDMLQEMFVARTYIIADGGLNWRTDLARIDAIIAKIAGQA